MIMEQQTVATPNGDALLSPPEFEPATSQQPTPEQLAELANRILQFDVPGVA